VKLTALRVKDFRTIETLNLLFPSPYMALCGANDSGKTNVIRAIRVLAREQDSFFYIPERESLSVADDYPKWKDCSPEARTMHIEADFDIEQNRDAGLYQFLLKQLSLEKSDPIIRLTLRQAFGKQKIPSVSVGGKTFEGLDAQEVFTRVQSGRCVLFHNSTELPFLHRLRGGNFVEVGQPTPDQRKRLESLQKKMASDMLKIAKTQQEELERLLGRLERKYRVGMSPMPMDLDVMPFRMTLGEKKYEVPLDDWGSGTRNRTLILHNLIRAKQISDSEASAAKITPIIIIEEPESFLHPSAQAEFGRILQDLAHEFDVQVIATSHSPYMLNIAEPGANILLRRRLVYGRYRETTSADTSGENWAEPFAEALGLRSEDFKPWRDLFLTTSEAVLLVEGSTDRDYLELLRDPAHGNERLLFDGEILPYEGVGTLQNTALLRFLKNRYPKLFILYDLDSAREVERSLEAVGLERNVHFSPVGRPDPGRRSIEGLLPDSVVSAVYAAHPDLVTAAVGGSNEERKPARNRLKSLLLLEFKSRAIPGVEFFKYFYPLAKIINRALSTTLSDSVQR
jgi:putative ATP-dependent endonuclease of OLD family